MLKNLLLMVLVLLGITAKSQDKDSLWVTYEGTSGPGYGKYIVLISGDEEYRSEEALPMLAKILAFRFGYKCTVLFALDPHSGLIDPTTTDNIPGLELLIDADLMVIFTRFRNLPDEQMRYIDAYVNSGKPIIGIRTATHAFRFTAGSGSFSQYSYDSKSSEMQEGFGRQVLGETWVDHHGIHGSESTKGLVNRLIDDHQILKGVTDIWVPTDVYSIRDVPCESEVLVYGQVLEGMTPESHPNLGKALMPVAWTTSYTGRSGTSARVFTTTMGSGVDFLNENLRRLVINAAFWAVGLENEIPERANVEVVGEYQPTWFGFGRNKPGIRPADHKLKSS